MVKRPSIAAIIWFLAFFVVSTILLDLFGLLQMSRRM